MTGPRLASGGRSPGRVGGVSLNRPAFDAYLLCREGGADAGVVLKICCCPATNP